MNHEKESMFDEMNIKTKLACGALVASLVVLGVLSFTLFLNREGISQRPHDNQEITKVSDNSTTVKDSTDGYGRTSDELDFWNMYDEVETEKDPDKKYSKDSVSADYGLTDKTISDDSISKNSLSGNSVSKDSVSKNTVSGDAFNVSNDEKNPELVEVNEKLPKNHYQPGFFRRVGDELEYYTNGRKTSTVGIDVSKYQGDIDWELVKESGVEFAMIRMGVRGYSSGKVVVDENFTQNIEGALSNGIKVGIYFYSQATTKEEAVEEANYAVAAVSGYTLAYPIVYMTETIENDTARTDDLTIEQRTECADYFCQTIKQYGYKPMIAGNEKQLATKLELDKLNGYDKWLMSPGETTDYPYQYSMWQYQSSVSINGITDGSSLNISFVDYAYK